MEKEQKPAQPLRLLAVRDAWAACVRPSGAEG